jgi:hypothetical protein
MSYHFLSYSLSLLFFSLLHPLQNLKVCLNLLGTLEVDIIGFKIFYKPLGRLFEIKYLIKLLFGKKQIVNNYTQKGPMG